MECTNLKQTSMESSKKSEISFKETSKQKKVNLLLKRYALRKKDVSSIVIGNCEVLQRKL